MKNAAIGFGIGICLILALYFFYHLPALNKEHERGLNECLAGRDTVEIPGKDSIIYRDTSFTHAAPVIIEKKDSIITVKSKFDSSFVSGKDSISFKSAVEIKIHSDSIKNQDGSIPGVIAKWLMEIRHKDWAASPDTIKIIKYKDKFIERSVEWYASAGFAWIISGIAYIGTVLAFILK